MKDPETKKGKTNQEKESSRKDYEEKQRFRTFQQSWITKFK